MNDFKEQYDTIKEEIDRAILTVLESGWYILGENVNAFEKEFAQYCGVKNAIGVGNGLEALQLAMLANNLGYGDEVITVANTAVATSLAISLIGAKPVFVDIDPETYCIDESKIKEKITKKTKAILPVHLYGHPANMAPLLELADRNNLVLIEDACQAHGAEYKSKKVGTFGTAGCFSFYPTKNLGAYGDGGMITTDDENIAKHILLLRNYGQKTRYIHSIKGYNSRLDELQAAILRVKLKYLNNWNEKRREKAKIYNELLKESCIIYPTEKSYAKHVYHLYVIRSKKRDSLQKFLGTRGIASLIHYPIPIHLQDAYVDLNLIKGTLPITEKISNEILSLPLYPELDNEQIETVVNAIKLMGA